MFKPAILDTLKGYGREQLIRDSLAGVIVGIVALPLAIAFAIASGVSPEKGLFTAVIAGFIISALGGSRVQIGGPTGAFIIIVYGIVQQYGVDGLIIATFMAGIMLILLGLAGMGAVIKYIPHPLIIGFTSGIALLIFSSQVKDFFGLHAGTAVPADFIEKWKFYAAHAGTFNGHALLVAGLTMAILLLWTRLRVKIPGSLVAILVTTAVAWLFHWPVETIGSRFGKIPSSLPSPVIPHVDLAILRQMIQPAFTIALLGGIESLLSAVVADGMIAGRHRSNVELIAQGVANIFSSLFGGIPATGAIARTATNVKSGGRTPVAGMIHALTLLLIMVVAGKWAALIPMATLSGILIMVAYNMSEWESFVSVLKGPRSDVAVLLTTFVLTVLVDLTVAIEIGMVMAAFLFMRKMIRASDTSLLTSSVDEKEIEVFEITGPLFFGVAHKFRDAIQFGDQAPKVYIIRMDRVPIIDATGIKTIADIYEEASRRGTRLILSEVNSRQVSSALKKARLLFAIGKANVTNSFEAALTRGRVLISERGQAAGESGRAAGPETGRSSMAGTRGDSSKEGQH